MLATLLAAVESTDEDVETLVLVVCLIAIILAVFAAWRSRLEAAAALVILAVVVGVVFL
jgi:heme/copper-type cytochrome/quinol oxidase subunit 3